MLITLALIRLPQHFLMESVLHSLLDQIVVLARILVDVKEARLIHGRADW